MYQNHWWYRLLQVLYVAGFLVAIITSFYFVYNTYHPRKAPLSYSEFTYLSENDLPMMESGKTTGSWTEVIFYSVLIVILIAVVFFLLKKLFFYIYEGKGKIGEGDKVTNDIFRGFMDGKYTQIHNPAGLSGIEKSLEAYSVGAEINDEKNFQTIKLLPKGDYDSHEGLGGAEIYFNRSDVRPRPQSYAEGVQDVYGLLEALEAGRVVVRSKESGEFYEEVKKGVHRDSTEERARYFFPDGTCFFDIRTKSITPRFRA